MPGSDGVGAASPGLKTAGERITKQIYEKFDSNGDGVIDRQEFTALLRALDPQFFTDARIQTLFQAADVDHSGKIDYSEFVAWLTQEEQAVHRRIVDSGLGLVSGEDSHKILKYCESIDGDDSGYISRAELREALTSVPGFAGTSKEEIEDLLNAVDINKDGQIQYPEFLQWMGLPSEERLSFEDNVRNFVKQHDRFAEAAPRRDYRMATGGQASQTCDEAAVLANFTHPLLSRVSVVDSDAISDPSSFVVVEIEDEAHGFGSARGSQPGVRERVGGSGFSLIARPPSLDARACSSRGLARVSVMVSALAEVYEQILSDFVGAVGSKGLPANATLRLCAVAVPDSYGHRMKQSPELCWSGFSLALSRLSLPVQQVLEKAAIQMLVMPGAIDSACEGSSALEHQDTLKAKVEAAEAHVKPEGQGSLEEISGNRNWIRKDNSPDARLKRLQAFMVTLRSMNNGGYVLNDSLSMLVGVEKMVAGTRVNDYSKLPAPVACGTTEILTLSDAGLDSRDTVMSAAKKLADKGHKVVAVNAASAYSRGGGVTGGGRHALEEAWCMCSTLYQSLNSVDHVPMEGTHTEAGGTKFEQHIPATSVIVSPEVEMFREGTMDGYGFLETPTQLAGVISVAMFNRNPGVSDSPLDSPADAAEYYQQTLAKVGATIFSSIQLGAQVLVIPDIGCGVFQNDPQLIGGCIGHILNKTRGCVKQVVVLGKPSFVEACKAAFDGQDPRGGTGGVGGTVVEDALLDIARNPEKVEQPACRYGAACRNKKCVRSHPDPPADTRHGASHYGGSRPADDYGGSKPDYGGSSGFGVAAAGPLGFCSAAAGSGSASAGAGFGSSAAGGSGADQPPSSSIGSSGRPKRDDRPNDSRPNPGEVLPSTSGGGATSSGDPGPPVDSRGSGGSGAGAAKRRCKYGENCFNKSAAHVADFSHPPYDEEESAGPALEDLAHRLISLAKTKTPSAWIEIKTQLRAHPEAVNIRPASRNYGILHFAAWYLLHDQLKTLVVQYKADINQKTGDGKTVQDLLKYAMEQTPGETNDQKADDEKSLRWVQMEMKAAAKASGEATGLGSTMDRPTRTHSSSGGAASRTARTVSMEGAPAKPAGVQLNVKRFERHELNGKYVEIDIQYENCAVYRKDALGAQKAMFLYHSRDERKGWVIASDDSDKPPRILAYLGERGMRRDPWLARHGVQWSCQSNRGPTFKPDILAEVEKL